MVERSRCVDSRAPTREALRRPGSRPARRVSSRYMHWPVTRTPVQSVHSETEVGKRTAAARAYSCTVLLYFIVYHIITEHDTGHPSRVPTGLPLPSRAARLTRRIPYLLATAAATPLFEYIYISYMPYATCTSQTIRIPSAHVQQSNGTCTCSSRFKHHICMGNGMHPVLSCGRSS